MSEKIRVLIVDDSFDMQSILQNFLHFLAPDMEVIALASSGPEGIRLTREFQPDIVLMDINLPGVNGLEATQAIVREMPLSQVILMSADQVPEDQQHCEKVGARHLFTKPIDCDELLSVIRTIHAN